MNKINSFFYCLLFIFLICSVGQTQQNAESDDFSYALKLYNEKFYDLAAQQFIRFVNKYPGSDKIAEAGFYAGMSLFNLHDYENARIEFQRVAVDYPEDNRAAESWFMIGECYQKQNNESEAAKAYEMIKLLHPKHQNAAKSILKAGQLYQKLKNYEKAEQLYNLIQNRYIESSEYFEAILAHGSLHINRGEFGKASEKLNKVLEGNALSDLKSQALLLLGEMYRTQGFQNKAKEPLRTILNNYSSTKPAIIAALTLSKILLNEGAFAEVQSILNSALKSSTTEDVRGEMLEKLADAYYLNKQYALAAKNYTICIPSDKNEYYLPRKLKLALSSYRLENLTRSLDELEPIPTDTDCENLPGYKECVNYFLQLCYDNNLLKEGTAELIAIEKKRGLNQNELRWLAKFLRTDNAWNMLTQKFETVVYTQPTNPDIDSYIFDLAVAYENLNRYSESQKYVEKLINDYPASELYDLAHEKLDYLRRYYITDKSMSVDGLALLVGEVIKGDDPGSLHYRLGHIYFDNLKNYKKAVEQFELAFQSGSQEVSKADILFYSGLAYQYMAEREDNVKTEKANYYNKAREKFNAAMENLQDASDPALISWKFVELGSQLDEATPDKQITYYKTLLNKYPDSPYSEFWHTELIDKYDDKSASSEVLEHYRALLQNYPDSDNRPSYLIAYVRINDKISGTELSDAYKNIAAEFPGTRSAARALLYLGQLSEERRNFSEALQFYNKLIKEYFYTDLADQASQRLGDVLLLAGKQDEAIRVYQEQLSALPPDDIILNKEFFSGRQIHIYYKLGRAYHTLGQWQDAQENIAYFLLSETDGLYVDDARILLGEVYLALGDKNSAVVSLSKVSKSDPELYQKAVEKIAEIYFDLGQYEESAQAYKNFARIIQGQDGESDAHAQSIIASIRAGKINEAEKLITEFNKRFKKKDSYSAAFTFEFGDYYRRNKNFKKAQSFLSTVTKKYPKSSHADNAEYFLALTYITQNKQKEALDILANFAQKYQDSEKLGAVYNTLGSIYFRSEKYESALTSFKRALDKPIDDEQRRQVMSNLIKTYTFVNFWDAALALAKDYIKKFPHADDLIDKKILIGRAYTYLNQIDRAVEHLKETRLIADSEKEPEIQFYVGDAYFKSGQYENAIAEFVKIPFLSRKTKLQWEASALYYSGQAYEKLGRIDDAIRMYQEIVKRPGIDLVLKKDAQKRIEQIKG